MRLHRNRYWFGSEYHIQPPPPKMYFSPLAICQQVLLLTQLFCHFFLSLLVFFTQYRTRDQSTDTRRHVPVYMDGRRLFSHEFNAPADCSSGKLHLRKSPDLGRGDVAMAPGLSSSLTCTTYLALSVHVDLASETLEPLGRASKVFSSLIGSPTNILRFFTTPRPAST